MVLLTNAVNANDSTSARLLTSTNISDLSNIEMSGIKAIIQDHIVNDSNASTVATPSVVGTFNSSDYDFKSHNMINQDAFGSQVHVLQTSYNASEVNAVNTSVNVGPFLDSNMSLLNTTSPFIGGNVVVTTTSPGNQFNLTISGESSVDASSTITFVGSDASNVAQKIALSSFYNDVESSTLFETKEDASNSSLISRATDFSSIFGLDLCSNTLLSDVESNNMFGTYTITQVGDNRVMDHSGSIISMIDNSGNAPDTIFSLIETDICNQEISAATHFLPSEVINLSVLKDQGDLIYDICLGVTSVGTVGIASNDGGFAIKDTLASDLLSNTDFMGVLASNNTNKTAADTTSITYAITNTVVGFNSDKTATISDSSNTSFNVSLSTSQEELLTSDVSGSVTFVKDDIDSRATLASGDSNVFTGLNVYFGDEATADSGSVDISGMVLQDVSYNISLVMPDVSNTNITGASNIMNNGFITTGSQPVIAINDERSVLIDASDMVVSDVSLDTFIPTNDSVMTIIKGEFKDRFSDKSTVVDVLNSSGETSSSFTTEEFRLEITGSNVNLEEITNTPYDGMHLQLIAKSLTDLSYVDNFVISNSAYDITNNATGASETTPIVLKQTADSLLDAGFAEIYNTDVHPTDICLNMTFKYVPTIAGKKFGSYILQEIDTSYSNITSHQKQIFPSTNDISVNSTTTSTETVSVTGLSNSSYSVTKTTTSVNKDVTIDFEFGVYQNLKIKLKSVVETDVEYKVFDGTRQLPEYILSGVTEVGGTQDLYDFVRSRTITYNGVSYVQPSSGSVSSGDANVTFTLNKTILNSLKSRIHGRNPSTLEYTSSESFSNLDAFYNNRNVITGFENDTDATFIIYLSADDSITLDNVDGYRIIMDIQRGSSNTFDFTAKHYLKSELESNLSFTSTQDLFDLHATTAGSSTNLPAISFNVSISTGNPVNTLTLTNADGDVLANITSAEKSLITDFMFVITKGSVFSVDKTLNGTTSQLDPVLLVRESVNLKIDDGIVAAINDDNIALNVSDGVWSLNNANVQVKFDIASDYDFNGRFTDSLVVSDASFQDITFSAYRGITHDITHSIERTVGSIDFTLANGGSTTQNLLIGNNMTLDFTGTNGVGDTGIIVTQSNNSRFSDASFNDVSNGNLIITPTKYLITESISAVNVNTLDLTSDDLSNVAINNLTPTSFDSELLNFYDRKISATRTNDVTGGIFIPSKIGTDSTEFLRVKNKEMITVIVDPTSTSTTYQFDVNKSSKLIPNTPIVVSRFKRDAMSSEFTLNIPQQEVTYRNINDANGDLLGSRIDTSSNIITEKYDITSSGIISLVSADISLSLPVHESLAAYETVSSDIRKIDMYDHTNSISNIQITYSNTSISNEDIVSTSTKISDLSGGSDNTFLITHTQNPQNTTGGNVITNYDISLNLSNNIFINIPHAFVDTGSYTMALPEFNGIKTSLIGGHYTLDASSNPVIELRKYTSIVHAPLNEFTLNEDGFKAVNFVVDKVEEASVSIPEPTFTTGTPFNFQTTLSNLASDTSFVTFTEISFNTISGENVVDNASSQALNYVLVGLDEKGRGNLVELMTTHSGTPVKSLLIETPDVSRILSGDGAPIFRLRANGNIDAPKIATTDRTTKSTSMLGEYVAYNKLITK